jgi:hypothetical protein
MVISVSFLLPAFLSARALANNQITEIEVGSFSNLTRLTTL